MTDLTQTAITYTVTATNSSREIIDTGVYSFVRPAGVLCAIRFMEKKFPHAERISVRVGLRVV